MVLQDHRRTCTGNVQLQTSTNSDTQVPKYHEYPCYRNLIVVLHGIFGATFFWQHKKKDNVCSKREERHGSMKQQQQQQQCGEGKYA